jgi:hypothetical protein
VCGALISVRHGQDAFWDLQNYHFYNPWALLHGRSNDDISAAGLQSFYNPLPDIPYFVLATRWFASHPALLAAAQGLWFGAFIFTLYQLTRKVAQLQHRTFGYRDVCAVAIGASGAMAVSQVGLSSNEVMLATFALASLWLALRGLQDGEARPATWFGGACLLAGLAAGLKPTTMPLTGALVVAIAVSQFRRGPVLRLATLCAATALAGFLVTYGPWGLHLYLRTGNPIFPHFNDLFRSDWSPPMRMTDERFKPRSPAEWLFYPVKWMTTNVDVVTEQPFSDVRYAVALVAIVTLIASALWAKRERAGGASGGPPSRTTVLLATYFLVTYVAWLVTSSILRYAVTLEALSGLLVLLAGDALAVRTRGVVAGAARHGSMLLFLAVALGTTSYPDWGHQAFAERVFVMAPTSVPPGSVVVLAGQPMAFIAPLFEHAEAIDFVGLTYLTQPGYGLWTRSQERIRDEARDVYVVSRPQWSDGGLEILRTMFPRGTLEDCRPLETNFEQMTLCRFEWDGGQ